MIDRGWTGGAGGAIAGVVALGAGGLGARTARCGIHSGFSVPTTNITATATVTAWENRSQVLRMVGSARGSGSDRRGQRSRQTAFRLWTAPFGARPTATRVATMQGCDPTP